MVDKETNESVISCVPLSDSDAVQLENSKIRINIIQGYALTSQSEDMDIEEIYAQTEQLWETVKKH